MFDFMKPKRDLVGTSALGGKGGDGFAKVVSQRGSFGSAGDIALGAIGGVGRTLLGTAYFLVWLPSMLKLKTPGLPLPVQFRPNKLHFESASKFESAMQMGASQIDPLTGKKKLEQIDLGYMEFKGNTPGSFTADLFYDSTTWQLPVKLWVEPVFALAYPLSTNPYVEGLRKMGMVKAPPADKASPPLVRFWWGLHISRLSYVSKVTVDYSQFHPAGYAMRADVKVELTPYTGDENKAPQNPTSKSDARATYTVQMGDSLDMIAFREFGSTEYWRHIADTNNLSNPRNLRSGQILKIVPME